MRELKLRIDLLPANTTPPTVSLEYLLHIDVIHLTIAVLQSTTAMTLLRLRLGILFWLGFNIRPAATLLGTIERNRIVDLILKVLATMLTSQCLNTPCIPA